MHSLKIGHWILPFTLLGSAVGFGAVLTPPDIPEQRLIRGIYNWGDAVAVVADNYDPANHTVRYSLGIVDEETGRIVPFRALKCDSYEDIGYSDELGRLLVCGDGRLSRIYQLRDGSWKPISDTLPGDDFRIAVDHERIVAIADDTLFLISGLSKRIVLRMHFKVGAPHHAPAALILRGHAVVLGYDTGEFGGGLYRLELDPTRTSAKLLESGNIRALGATSSGEIWVADGLAHMTLERGALYRLNGDRLETVASSSGMITTGEEDKVLEQAGVPFPGASEISGLAVDHSDRPVVAFPAFGIYELVDGKFVGLIETPLEFSYSMPGYSVSSRPEGLAIGKSGDIYVAMRSLGVLVFHKSGAGFDTRSNAVRQVLFPAFTGGLKAE